MNGLNESGLVNVCQPEVSGLDEIILDLESQPGVNGLSTASQALINNFVSTCQPAVEVESAPVVANPMVVVSKLPQDSPKTSVIEISDTDKEAVVMLSVKAINTAEPFKGLFTILPQNLSDIADNMKATGYDLSKPIVLWAGHSNIILDGHTRLQAAELAGLLEVPVMRKHFESEDEAYDYVVKCQVNRRNLSDAELTKIVRTITGRGRGGISGISKSNPQCCGLPPTTAELAKKLNVSPRKIEQVKQINAKASSELLKEVDDGKKSVNKACNEIKARKKVEVIEDNIVDEVFEYIMGKNLQLDELKKLILRLEVSMKFQYNMPELPHFLEPEPESVYDSEVKCKGYKALCHAIRVEFPELSIDGKKVTYGNLLKFLQKHGWLGMKKKRETELARNNCWLYFEEIPRLNEERKVHKYYPGLVVTVKGYNAIISLLGGVPVQPEVSEEEPWDDTKIPF